MTSAVISISYSKHTSGNRAISKNRSYTHFFCHTTKYVELEVKRYEILVIANLLKVENY